MALLRLQLASTLLTCSLGKPFGMDGTDQSATQGTQAARSDRMKPRYCAYRRNERSALVITLARLRLSDEAKRCTDLTTSATFRSERLIGPPRKRCARNSLMKNR